MRLGLVSDTHDNVGLSRVAAAFFRETRADLVLHLGDITGPATVECFSGLPMRFLQGNNDEPRRLAPALARAGFPALALSWSCDIGGVRVVAHHGHLPPPLREEPDLLVHGHSHHARSELMGRSRVVNPGALFRAAVRSVCLVELPSLEVAFYALDEVTGARPWSATRA